MVLISKSSIIGFGLNLQVCHNVAFVGLSDSWEQYHQFLKRVHRFGQLHEVNCHIFVSSAEGAILQNIKKKEESYINMGNEIVKHTKDFVQQELTQTTSQKNEYKTNTVEKPNYKLMLGDCCERIKEIPDKSIDYSIYSPPFSSLYVYSNSERDMGNSKSYEEFTEHFSFLAKAPLSHFYDVR